MEIGEPSLLTKLPRAGVFGEGRTQFCQVFGIRDGQRKKRHEICAAVDGNSVNIYEIANGRNLVSWPVPPDSVIICAPVSERVSRSSTTFERRTWCAVKRGAQISIACYQQTKQDGQSTSSVTNLPLSSKAPVVKIESVDTAGRFVVAVQEDGTLSVFNSDTAKQVSTQKLISAEEQLKTLAVHCTSTSAALKTFLKSRSDISAGLPANSISIACLYEDGQQKELRFGIWTLSLDKSVQSSETIQCAVSHKLGYSGITAGPRKISIEIKGGSVVEIKNAGQVITYDLTTIVPQRLADVKQPLPECVSDLELATNLYLCANASKLQLWNRDFGSIQASTDVSSSSLKRKRDQDGSRLLSFIAYFSQMRRALACIGNQVLAIDIHTNDLSSFKQSSLLIGNILRGADKQSQPRNPQSDKQLSIGRSHTDESIPNWSIVSKELDSLVEKNDTTSFEEIFKKTFNVYRAKDMNASKVPDSKMNYLLSKMFAVATVDGNPDQKRLKIMFLPEELMHWSISGGYVDNYRIDQALEDSITSRRPDAILLALADADTSMKLAESYLRTAPFLDPEVLKLCIHVLMRKVLEADEAGRVQAQASATNSCLLQALRRFALTGASVVSKQLRDFDRAIILPVIQVLRQQMFLGGYGRLARSYPSPAPSEDGKPSNITTSQLDLACIVVLLNGCVDAIGPLGIFGTDDAYGSIMQRVVPELLSEVGAACRGVEDSTMLQGLVRETLRYSESVERQPFEVRQKNQIMAAGKGTVKGQIVTLYAEPETDESGVESGSALPLSLKAAEDLSGLKVRKGGQTVKRSAREMGVLRDRLKSAYSFERLIL